MPDQENAGAQRHYFHKDHLGSIVAVSDSPADDETRAVGEIVDEYSFSAWGQRRDPGDWDEMLTPDGEVVTDRGFTGHEMIDAVALIHMNGRLFDPGIGRMISPDPFVPEPKGLQSYNRYSYVVNNPLSYVDPSGYFFGSIVRAVKSFARSLWSPIESVVKGVAQAVSNLWQAVRPYAGTIAAVGFSMAGMAPVGFAVSGMISLAEGASLQDVVIGVAIGAVAGVTVGPLAARLTDSIELAARQMATSVVRGGMTGAAAGATTAVVYGRDAWKGAYRGAAVGAATSAVVHLYRDHRSHRFLNEGIEWQGEWDPDDRAEMRNIILDAGQSPAGQLAYAEYLDTDRILDIRYGMPGGGGDLIYFAPDFDYNHYFGEQGLSNEPWVATMSPDVAFVHELGHAAFDFYDVKTNIDRNNVTQMENVYRRWSGLPRRTVYQDERGINHPVPLRQPFRNVIRNSRPATDW